MENKRKILNNSGAWVGVGTAIGAAIYAITNEPTWIAVGVAIGAALSWRKPKKSKDQLFRHLLTKTTTKDKARMIKKAAFQIRGK